MKNDKKIGIITYHASHNCGSMMQSYALQTILNKLGYENEIIDFQNAGQKDMYAVVHKRKGIKSFIKNFILFPHRKEIKKQWINYENFKNKTFNLSKDKYHTSEDLKKTNDLYDTFISGADQIWNITIKDSDDSYFLNFAEDNKNKIAYAPSFGAKNILENSDNPDKYANYLKSYNHLSIRENNGKKWIKDLIGKDVEVVLDPTLLLPKEDYDKILEPANINFKYIFYYAPVYKKHIDKFVKKLSKKYKLPVIVWNSREYYMKAEYLNKFIKADKQSPAVYLDLIKNAELVITTSFHGTIFSTMYGKKFWTMKNGNMYNTDDRVITLMEQLGLTDRLIEPNFAEEKDYFSEVDYTTYKNNLEKLQEKSINYLKESIDDNE